MSWARLRVSFPVLERMLHLEEHGIQIVHARTVTETDGTPVLEINLQGDGLPDTDVIAIVRRLEDGREILERLKPINP